MNRTIWILVVLVGAVSALIGVLTYADVWARFRESDSSSIPVERTKVNALGRLEPADGVIHLAIPVGDRIGVIHVKAGDEVKAGQELARLQSYDDRRVERDLAAAQLAEAQARLQAITDNGNAQLAEADLRIKQITELGPLDIQSLKTKADLLMNQHEQAKKNWERIKALNKGSTISPMEREQQELAVQKAKAEWDAAQNELDKAKKGNELNLESAKAQKRTLEASLKRAKLEVPLASAEQNAKVAEQRLKSAVIRAPTAGTILKVFARPGESGGQQPLLRMADLGQMVVVAEVYETDVRFLKEKMPATVTSKALDSSLSGEIVAIGRTVARNSVFELNPAADADHRVVEVRILLGRDPLAARFVNMQVDVEIPLEKAARR